MLKAITLDTKVVFIVSATPFKKDVRMIARLHVFSLIAMLRLVEQDDTQFLGLSGRIKRRSKLCHS